MLSSSPVFPSLDDLIARSPKKSTLRSGSRAAPIPENAARSFTSAADFMRAGHVETAEDVLPAPEPQPPQKSRKTAKAPKAAKKSSRAPKAVIDLSADTPPAEPLAPAVKRRRKPLAEKNSKPVSKLDDGLDQGSSPLKEKPWKKYKAAQEDARAVDSNEEELNASKPQEIGDVNNSPVASKTSPKKPRTSSRKPKSATPEPLNLEPSLPRRLDWTPPKPDVVNLMSDVSEAQEAHTPGSTGNADMVNDVFKNLRDNFGCKEDKAIPVMMDSDSSNAAEKRKVIQMETAGENTKGDGAGILVPKVKAKVPKKKPRTITELATAAYIVKPLEPQDSGDSLQPDYQPAIGGQDSTDSLAGAIKATRKTKASKVTKKKAEPKRQILLSPQAALRQSAAQDFVFGTSSQLAFEQSPTFLRDLQAAIQASNAAENNPFSSPIQSAAAARRKAGNKLWSVGARDEDGELMDLEVIDLVNSPAFPNDDVGFNPILNPWKDLPPEAASTVGDSPDVEFPDVNSVVNAPKSRFFQSQQAADDTVNKRDVHTINGGEQSSSSRSERIEVVDEPPPSNQEQTMEDATGEKPAKPRKAASRPKYEVFTDIQLAKQVKSYGFKPVKKRSAMIALLDQCWASKNQISLQPSALLSTTTAASSPRPKSSDASKPACETASPPKPRGRPKKSTTDAVKPASTKAAAASPKRPRGRPRKDSLAAPIEGSGSTSLPQATNVTTPKRKTASKQTPAEIADSDCDELPSSPMLPPGQEFSPVGVNLAVGQEAETEMSLTLDPTDQQAALFKHITKAVTMAPRSKDPSEPSWHEKMLLYDPIVLEDLAAWLNSGQLTQAGFDGEVSPADVKKWCESKSICCLWRINLNGKERKRF